MRNIGNFAVMDVLATLQQLAASATAQEQEAMRKELSVYLNHLLVNDFAALVQLLYRVDVPEQKVKTVLAENPQADAGDLLAELILQRQKEKLMMRESFPPTKPASEEEAW